MRRRSHVKGPPAHVLARMTTAQKRVDQITREPSEGGYSGMVKARTGMMVRDIKAVFERENGKEENATWLAEMQTKIQEANTRKRTSDPL